MRILIVDDDVTTLLCLAERVRARGHEADVAASAADALALLAAGRYDAAAVDLVLGAADGAEVARAALASGARVVIDSARDEPAIREAVESLGGGGRVHALQKPFDEGDLLALLGAGEGS